MDENRKIDLALKVLDNNQNLIKFADTKINVLLVLSGVTTTFILTNFQDLYDIGFWPKFFLVLFFLAFILFMIFSILTIAPRKANQTGNSVPKVIYFEHIASRVEAKDFITEYNNITPEIFLADTLYQIYETAKIASRKFKYYRFSMISIQIQILLFFILLALKLVK